MAQPEPLDVRPEVQLLDREALAPADLPKKAKKAFARVQALATDGYFDVFQRAGPRLDKLAGAVFYTVGRIVNSKHIPAAAEQAVAERILLDLIIRAGTALTAELRADLAELVADTIDQLRRGGHDWKPRG